MFLHTIVSNNYNSLSFGYARISISMRFPGYTLLSFLLLVTFAQLQAQEQSNMLKLVSELSKYRANILADAKPSLDSLSSTLKRWRTIEPSEETFHHVLYNLRLSMDMYVLGFERFVKLYKKHHPNSKLAEQITYEEAMLVLEHSELSNLIITGILNEAYPFSIDPSSSIYQELTFYDIQANESIAEIGAGDGTFSLLLYICDQNNSIYVNELNFAKLNYAEKQVKKGNLNFNGTTLEYIHGKRKETRIPEPVDKIIIRKTIHHFSKMKRMLKSIDASLKPGGYLLIKETLKELKPDACAKLMTEAEIKSVLNKGGFELVDELRTEFSLILKLQKKQ